MIKINGVDLPKFPSTFKVTISDLDDQDSTARTMDGILHRDRIAIKQKIELSFKMLTGPELATTLQMISDVFFDVTYPNPYTGADDTKTFYVGDRSAPVGKRNANGDLFWTEVSFNFVEK